MTVAIPLPEGPPYAHEAQKVLTDLAVTAEQGRTRFAFGQVGAAVGDGSAQVTGLQHVAFTGAACTMRRSSPPAPRVIAGRACERARFPHALRGSGIGRRRSIRVLYWQ